MCIRDSIAVMHEGAMLDMKLIPIIEQANNDLNYQATLIALDEKAIPNTLHPNHPANRYARVWKSLKVFPGPNGRLILYKQGRVVIPDTAIEHTLSELHQHHASVSEMTETAAMSVWWKGMEESIRQKVRACNICEESQRLRYDGEPMDM